MRSERIIIEDASGYRGYADETFTPGTEQQLLEILRRAQASSTPVTIGGAGTGVAGGRVPHGGWSIALERFRRLEIGEGSAVVGAGVPLRELQAAAAKSGQFYAPDPTENLASIGGTIATNASGSRSFLYGDTRRHLLAARVMLVDGTVLDLKRGDPVPFSFTPVPRPQTTKNTAGYFLQAGMDYLDLFIGSEGTLGVVTEATVKLLKAPPDLLSGVVFLKSDEMALSAVESWRSVTRLRMLEYMDAGSLDLLRTTYADIPADAAAVLMIEQELTTGNEIDEWLERLASIDAFQEESWFGTEASDRERFRVFRHALPEAVNETVRRRGLLKFGTDFAVPIANNRDMLRHYRDLLEREFGGRYVIFGHIGDAHLHANILPRDEAEASRAQGIVLELASRAVSLGGTVSAEHGLGKRKAQFLNLMYESEQIDAMREVKRILDPNCLLGRGTVLSDFTL